MLYRISSLILITIFITAPAASYPADEPMLAEWREFSMTPGSKQLIEWLRCLALARLTGTSCKEKLKAGTPQYFGRLGIFITLIKGKKVRGCYGAFSHASADIAAVLADYLSGALTGDHRYAPLDVAELEATDIIITIASQPYPVDGPDSVDVLRYGISLSCGADPMMVYVPSEIRDVSHIQKFLQGKECQVSAFRAVTIVPPKDKPPKSPGGGL